MSKQPPIAKPAPVKSARPLCLNCKRPLVPTYRVVDASDLTASADIRFTVDAHPGDRDDRRRVWAGTWEGYPYRGAGDGCPTHHNSTCAIQHAAMLCRKLITGESIKLNDAGLTWWKQGRTA